ncbi:MAG: hypothetical protein JF615_09750 [Asticcacaulis sp.]|nr:hypothetical protein [Asticcacaulis sp.]
MISPIYVVFYFGAGAMIAWQSPAVRDYYAQGTSFEMLPLVALQFFRGALWAALAAIAVKSVSGPAVLRTLTVGLAFALFTVPILLYPNAFMPWPVREMHLIEVGSSNFLFGVLTGFILLVGKPKAGQPAAVHL